MRIIRPAIINDAALVSTSIGAPISLWSATVSYAKGRSVQDANHRQYVSQQDNNLNHPLTDLAWWVDKGMINRWRMFDQTLGTQSQANEELAVELKVPSRVNAVALFNVEAAAVQVTATVDGQLVYDRKFQMAATSGIGDWHAYLFEPIERRRSLIITDLPLYSNMLVRIFLTRPGGTVLVGALIIGQLKDLGKVEQGLTATHVDFSRKEFDDFGNAILVKRAFAKKLEGRVLVDNDMVDSVTSTLEQLRATPLVWIADDRFATTSAYGFFRSFSTTFAYRQHSLCLLEIEGMT